jgi:hypothetical protein
LPEYTEKVADVAQEEVNLSNRPTRSFVPLLYSKLGRLAEKIARLRA